MRGNSPRGGETPLGRPFARSRSPSLTPPHPVQLDLTADSLQPPAARQLRPPEAVVADGFAELGGHQHAARAGTVGDPACEVDRPAEPVAGALERLAAGDARAQLREVLAHLVRSLD